MASETPRRGPGRPPLYATPRRRMTVEIDPALVAQVKATGLSLGLSLTWVVETALRAWLVAHESEGGEANGG